ncbi:aldo/keto reductase [Actinoplanes couchii]|uniref:Aldo/keto reductase n=1 Tax=Actinoplanes couchii TaxID=403638 RepID=A0ABQ3X528_9ACTN|nr:aldo/keto reductase [Actinoplanes couchii]MDR6326139.1 aryl-alcohol dehydrogenase-like predicted oxidoreductase [Actinoplanes couchii]GID53508.1 aldo/keto reductase [Actinoplanes couchii]
METRDFGRLGRISALTLGGGGIGGVWGGTDRAEAVATVHAAIDAGITMLDLAPSYGTDFESEHVVAEALRGSAHEVHITSKVQLPDDDVRDFAARIRRSLHHTLRRLNRDHLDVFLLHTQFRPDGTALPGTVTPADYRAEIAPEFARLRDEGLIRAWGISAVGDPASVREAFRTAPAPDAAQIVVNALDQNGDMWIHGDTASPDNEALLTAAAEASVAVIAIRAVAAGSLTSALDRPVAPDHPAAIDFARAAPFRELAAARGESPAALAHRYALSVPGVSTVVLGVKNRDELAECLKAESQPRLAPEELATIRALA